MIAIISPAKNLSNICFIPLLKVSTVPCFITKADSIANSIKSTTSNEYKKLMSLSSNLADKTFNEYQNYIQTNNYIKDPQHNDGKHTHAGLLFDGPAYKGLDLASLDNNSATRCQNTVRFLSGLYGILKPFDLIQRHRLEMGTKNLNLPSSHKNLYDFWREDLADYINNSELKYGGILLNCASEEYFKVIPLKLLNNNIKVINCVFLDKGKIVTVFAKKARGLMCRFISMNDELNILLNKISKDKSNMNIDHLNNIIRLLKDFNLEGYKFVKIVNEDISDCKIHCTISFNRTVIPVSIKKENAPKRIIQNIDDCDGDDNDNKLKLKKKKN